MDGYHFGRFDVYCPWDVMNYMRDRSKIRKQHRQVENGTKNKKMQVTVSYITVTCIFLFRSIIYKKLPIASHFYIHVTSAAEKASALFYPLSHTRMDK